MLSLNKKFVKARIPDDRLPSIRYTLYAIRFLFVLFVVSCLLSVGIANAQSSLALTVTPPLFQLTVKPGEVWSSALKIVNTNPGDLVIYATVTDFQAQGEAGHGKFIPLDENADVEGGAGTLARWVEISKEPVVIPVQQSREVPFTIRVPQNAPPGGHYAAILVGTQPAGGGTGNQIQVASYVTSLLFLRISGDVREEGAIREFAAEKNFYQEPSVAFTLRFENTGNVHLRPQGDIMIYNMWGKERGLIPINQRSDFGNVLPQSVRKYVFAWEGEKSFLEAGKYKAVLTLGFGNEARQNVSATSYFWVVPIKSTFGILGGIIGFVIVLSWAIRRYVRKVLETEAARFGRQQTTNNEQRTTEKQNPESIPDTKYQIRDTQRRSQGDVLRKPNLAGLILLMIFFGLFAVALYFRETLIPARRYEVFILDEDGRKVKLEVPR